MFILALIIFCRVVFWDYLGYNITGAVNKKELEKLQMRWSRDDILYEDEEILVCRKHAGMAVQSARVGQMDMESALKVYLQGGYLGIVQRLDQPVEGVLVFGKTPKATAALNRQQQEGIMKKWYLAVFCGKPEDKSGCLVDYLRKDGRNNRSEVVTEHTPGGKKAILNYEVIQWKDSIGLAKIRLLTGRHHQIRVQMACHGMPLAGDGKYGVEIRENRAIGKEKEKYSGLGLCACRLEFCHPKTGKKLCFQIKPEGKCFLDFQETVSIDERTEWIL